MMDESLERDSAPRVGRAGEPTGSKKDVYFYDLLEVQASASMAEIKRAFRKLSRNSVKDESVKGSLVEAHDVLSDSALRRIYNAHGREAVRHYRAHGTLPNGGVGGSSVTVCSTTPFVRTDVPAVPEVFSSMVDTVGPSVEPSVEPMVDTSSSCTPRLDFTVNSYHGIAAWTFDSMCDTCGICKSHLTEVCIQCQAEGGNESGHVCSISWGVCNHAFHTYCIGQWLMSRDLCPLDQQPWTTAECRPIGN